MAVLFAVLSLAVMRRRQRQKRHAAKSDHLRDGVGLVGSNEAEWTRRIKKRGFV